ncbi:MAG: hypothetical protein AAF549_00820 [Pseudomonadota bacterium]
MKLTLTDLFYASLVCAPLIASFGSTPSSDIVEAIKNGMRFSNSEGAVFRDLTPAEVFTYRP